VTTVTLNLSDDLQQFVADQTQAGSYSDPAAYIQTLIQRAKAGKAKIAELLDEGLDSGDALPLNADAWKRIRAEVEKRRSNG
jgi:antitoxin ParD1/3/4